MKSTTTDSSEITGLAYEYYYGQCWIAAHNAWNTALNPANNQGHTITELLDYGVRGFALDIWGDKGHLHLQHGASNPASSNDWDNIRDELKIWMANNPNEIVTLFFESYLNGPKPKHQNSKTPVKELSQSLSQIPSYAGKRKEQEDAMLKTKVTELITTNKRLFAFLEEEPVEGPQTFFPVMRELFAENNYGKDSVNLHTWNRLRAGSNYNNPFTFMNHFGDSPAGTENDEGEIFKHARDYTFNYGGRRPMFISLDRIGASKHGKGVIEILAKIPKERYHISPFTFTKIDEDNWNDVVMDLKQTKIVGFDITSKGGSGITSITPIYQDATTDAFGVTMVELVSVEGYGIVNMRYSKESTAAWGDWLTSYETSADTGMSAVVYRANGYFTGICCRTEGDFGVTDVALASPE
jgi:hypothetical protein